MIRLKRYELLKRLRTLLVNFNNKIPAELVPAFRASIIEKVGREEVAFHNHLGDSKFIYQYPLIQYKIAYGKPAIVCIDHGVEEIHKLFEQKNWKINLKGNVIDLNVDRLDLKSANVNIWNKKFKFQIFKWQALNEKNYLEYNNLLHLTDKIKMLESIMVGNIISFAKGIEWHIEKPVEVNIIDISVEKLSKMKNIRVATFDVKFTCNVSLPEWIGLGKGVSRGFGIIRTVKEPKLIER